MLQCCTVGGGTNDYSICFQTVNSQQHRANESREKPTGNGGGEGGGGGGESAGYRTDSNFGPGGEKADHHADEVFPTANSPSRGQPVAAAAAAIETPIPFAAAAADSVSANTYYGDTDADADADAADAADAAAASAAHTQFSIEVSYLEIYNESLRDLFNPATPPAGAGSESAGSNGDWGVGTSSSGGGGVGNTHGTTGLRLREDPR